MSKLGNYKVITNFESQTESFCCKITHNSHDLNMGNILLSEVVKIFRIFSISATLSPSFRHTLVIEHVYFFVYHSTGKSM